MMKVAFVFVVALAVYVSAQEVAPNEGLKKKFKSLRDLILSAAEHNKVPLLKALTWKNRESCQRDEYKMVPERLMDWFHVLKNIHLKNSSSTKESSYDKHFSKHIDDLGCSPVYKWFFKAYDTNKDMVLDVEDELHDIVSIETEHCLKPFFQNCDKNRDHKLTLEETCSCLNTVEPPCFEEMRNYEEKSRHSLTLGMMKPQCDEDGFYQSRQCHENYCWCVDRYNQKVEGTEARGNVDCPDNTDPNEVVFAGGEEDVE